MKRWVAGITTVMGCSWGSSTPAPQATPQALDCSVYDTAMRELKPWEPAGNLVSAVDAGFAVKRMVDHTATVTVAGTLKSKDFTPPELRITLNPKGAEEVERRVPDDGTDASKKIRETCQDGLYTRITGDVAATLVWAGRTLKAAGPVTVSAWGQLPSEMNVDTRIHEWELAGTAPQDWQDLVCLGTGQQSPCQFGPAYVELHGTLAKPELTVTASVKDQPPTVPLRAAWSAPAGSP